ncbi:Scr1 family TA system antitoxin-like transcriptional regulator [Streptomonospora arabica]|uniref:Scr1 family TA system antitoxin-like transcriptional regulator n=1 Tax=Streptomonospora arabica TaxID=412417 RepID=A0ABV9SLT4_9ACTN
MDPNKDALNEIGRFIRNIRNESDYSSRRLARLAKISQSTLSRIENGSRVEDFSTVEKVVSALPIRSEVAGSLHARIRAAYASNYTRRADSGISLVSDIARGWERSAVTVREFQSGMVPRAVRSPEYAQAADASPSRLVDRIGDEDLDFACVVTEGALRTWPADGAMMLDQLDRVSWACELPNVRLGVVPWSVPLPVMPPHGFAVFDDEAVVVETFTAQMTITEPDAVAAYVDAYAQLEAVAVTGDEARELVERIRRDFEELAH